MPESFPSGSLRAEPSLHPRCNGRRWPSCAERGWQEPGQSPSWCWGSRDAQSSHRTHALVPMCGRSSPLLSDWSCQSSAYRQGGKLWGRHKQPPNPALNPPSLQSQYLKQTIAMITTTMTNSSPAVAEPTIRGSSWKVLLVEPNRGGGRHRSQAGKGACTGGLGDRGSPALVPTVLCSCLKLCGEAVAAISSHRACPDLHHVPCISLQPVQPH